MAKNNELSHGAQVGSDPAVSFSFQVRFAGGAAIARCAGVDGLSKEVEMIEYRDSAKPNIPRFRQGRVKAPRITIKKAYIDKKSSAVFMEWISQADNGTVKPQNLEIIVGAYGSNVTSADYESQAGSSASVWQLYNCRPTKWSIGSLDGSSNGLIFESIELVAEEVYCGRKET